MKARHKDTGEIIELAEEGIISHDGRRFCWYQVELIPEPIDEVKPSLPSNLDEVTMDFARELDFFLYGSYTPERFPNSMQVRDEHSGLKVNDWKCWVNRPELRIEMVKHFFTIGKQVGAEWMAGQGGEIKGWLARHRNGELCLFFNKPEYKLHIGWVDEHQHWIVIDANLFPEIKFKDSPIEVIINIRKK